jgi:hypothetical protein
MKMARRHAKAMLRIAKAFAIILFIVICVDLINLGILDGGTLQVRIDSGDRRTRGFLLWFPEERVPGRAFLLRGAAEEGIARQWHTVPRLSRSWRDQARYWTYSRTAWWLEHEPPLGRIILRQVAEYYRDGSPDSDWGQATWFLMILEWNQDRSDFQISAFMRSVYDRESLEYELDSIEYVPQPGGVIEAWLASLEPAAAADEKQP